MLGCSDGTPSSCKTIPQRRVMRYLLFLGNCDCSFVGLVKHQAVSEEVLAGIEFQEVKEKGGLLHITLHCHHQNDSALTWAAI